MTHPHAHSNLVGTTNPDHLQENVQAALRGPLPLDLYLETKGSAKPGAKPESRVDPEQKIAGLETHLAEVESELQEASERRDVAKVASLGEECDSTRSELERAWEKWGE
jgi:hypothetical protein